MDHRKVAR